MRWGSCEGFANRNFACSPNSGADVLVASFSAPPGIDQLAGLAAIGRISSASGAVPPWWQGVSRGSCRYGSLPAAFDVSDQTACDDPWQGQAMGGIAYYRTDERGAEFEIAVAVPVSAARAASAGRTYAAFKVLVDHQRSSGPGSCDGCSTPMCITLESMTLATSVSMPGDPYKPTREIVLTLGFPGIGGASNVVTWQSGTPQCGAGAPRPSTWTKLKRHYE